MSSNNKRENDLVLKNKRHLLKVLGVWTWGFILIAFGALIYRLKEIYVQLSLLMN